MSAMNFENNLEVCMCHILNYPVCKTVGWDGCPGILPRHMVLRKVKEQSESLQTPHRPHVSSGGAEAT